MSPLARILSWPVKAYRLIGSPWVGHYCRYQPTCSAYALEALETHGAFKGGWLALRRILRCNPWGGQGYDPVPQIGSEISPETGQKIGSETGTCGCCGSEPPLGKDDAGR